MKHTMLTTSIIMVFIFIIFLFTGCPDTENDNPTAVPTHQNTPEPLPIKKLTKIGTWTTSYSSGYVAFNVFVSGIYAYLAFGEAGLQIIDISNPSNPVLVSTCNTTGPLRDVFVFGNYAYAATSESGLEIIDVSDVANPFITSSYNTGGYTYGVYYSENVIYLADGSNGLTIINVSDPLNPVFQSSYRMPVNANDNDVVVSGIYSYYANNSGGLQILNISNPLMPIVFGVFDENINAYDVCISGDYVYIADYSYGLKIFDVANKTNPKLSGSIQSIGLPHRLFIKDDYAYIASWGNLEIINISNQSNPSAEAFYNQDGYNIRGVFVVEEYIYVAQAYGDNALVIFTWE